MKPQYEKYVIDLPGYIIKGSKEFDKRRSVFNGSVNLKPAMIFAPGSIKEICQIVKFAKEFQISIGIKNGGHSAYGVCVIEDSIMIDMSKLNKIEVNDKEKTAKVQGGVLSGQLDQALEIYNMAIPLGDCPDVGVCGLALGGGNGFLSRKYGLTCDQILELEMVTSEGQLVIVNTQNNPILFWAMKGAGQNNFGIVTAITFRLSTVPPQLTVFDIFWPIHLAPQILEKIDRLLEIVGSDLALYPRMNRECENVPGLRIYGICMASEKISRRLEKEFMALGKPLKSNVYQTTYAKAQQINTASVTPEISLHWENAMLSERPDDAFYTRLVECFMSCPNEMGRINLDPLGGAIANSDHMDPVFIHRDQKYILSIIAVWSGTKHSEQLKDWARNCYQTLGLHKPNGQCYQNYAGKNYSIDKYFGHHLPKLIELKRQWDPDSIFEGLLLKGS